MKTITLQEENMALDGYTSYLYQLSDLLMQTRANIVERYPDARDAQICVQRAAACEKSALRLPELTPTERNVISMIRGEINLLIAATFRNAVAI